MASIAGYVKSTTGTVLVRSQEGEIEPLSDGATVRSTDELIFVEADSVIEWVPAAINANEGAVRLVGPGTVSGDQIADMGTGVDIKVSELDIDQLEPTATGELNTPAYSQNVFSLAQDNPIELTTSPIETITPDNTTDTSRSARTESDTDIFGSRIENDQLFAEDNQSASIQTSVTEDFSLTAQGRAPSASYEPSEGLVTTYGQANIDADGTWTYRLNNESEAVQALASGDSLADQFTMVSSDGQSIVVNVRIQGSNDLPEISGDIAGAVTEVPTSIDQNDVQAISTHGKLSIEDTDIGQNGFISQQDIGAAYGKASIDQSGNWVYELNNEHTAVQGLSQGDQLQDAFVVSSIDGSTQVISITINGSNALPVISGGGNDLAIIDISESLTASGSLSVVDADFDESKFISQQSQSGRYGEFSIDETGEWRYVVDENAAELAIQASGRIYESFAVRTADGTLTEVNIGLFNEIPDNLDNVAISSNTEAPLIAIEPTSDEPGSTYYWQLDQTASQDTISDFKLGPDGDTLVIEDLVDTAQNDLLSLLDLQFDGQDSSLTVATSVQDGAQTLIFENTNLLSLGGSSAEVLQILQDQGNLELPGLF